MDSQLLHRLQRFLFADPKLTRTRNCTHSDAVVLLSFGFGLIHNLSPRAAVQRRRWPVWYRKIAFPSYSQLMKRLIALDELLPQLRQRVRQQLPATQNKLIDGKPMTTSGFSHDPDVALGHVPGGFARGYKTHVLADAAVPIDHLEVTPLNEAESHVAQRLVAGQDLRGVTVRADANYDDHDLYQAVASAGGRLIAPRRKPATGSIALRELERIESRLSWSGDELCIRQIPKDEGPGNVVMLKIESDSVTEVFTAFGARGVTAMAVADSAIDEARAYLASTAPVGSHLADQLLIPFAMSGGGRFVATGMTPHAMSNIEVIHRFLDVNIATAATAGGTTFLIDNR